MVEARNMHNFVRSNNNDAEEKAQSEDDVPNWKPWRTSPAVVGPLLVTGVIIMAILHWLQHKGSRRMSESLFQDLWLNWYKVKFNPSPDEVREILTAPRIFNTSSTCINGLVNLDTSTSGTYFLWNYFPSLLAAALAIIWGVVDNEVKRMEPFILASQPCGAKAHSSLFAEYISLPSFLSPLQAIWWKQWTVLLSASCYVVMSTVLPVLQAFLFQTSTQVLQVGYFKYAPSGPVFMPLGSETAYSNRTDSSSFNVSSQLTWNCYTTDDIPEDKLLIMGSQALAVDEGPTYDRGFLHEFMYVDLSTCIPLGIFLLIVAALGVTFLWRWRKQSGMRSACGDLATLASLLVAEPGFRSTLSNLTDLNLERSRAWREHLEAQTVHLGPIPADRLQPVPSVSSDTASAQIPARTPRPYGFYFSSLSDQGVTIPPSDQLDNLPRHTYWTLWVLRGMGAALLIVAVSNLVSGSSLSTQSAIVNEHNRKPGLPIMSLIASPILKSLWKVIERRFVESPFTRIRICPVFKTITGKPRPLQRLSRQYARHVPGWLTICTFRDGEIILGFVTLMGLLLEVFVIFSGILTSLSRTTGLSQDSYKAISWFTAAMSLFVFLVLFLAYQWALPLVPPNIKNVGGVSKHLSLVSSSPGLLKAVEPLTDMTSEQSKFNHLKSLDARVRYRAVPAPELSGGYTYGFEVDE